MLTTTPGNTSAAAVIRRNDSERRYIRTPSLSAVVTGTISASSVSGVDNSRRRPLAITATMGAPSVGEGVL